VNDEDFSQHPKTIGEIRAEKTENAKDWRPRDALIDLLRQIDNGLEIKNMVIVYETETEYCDKSAVDSLDKSIALMYRGLNARLNR